ncbi:MAG TPA: hypothetical protein VML75_12805, partial [Kofleriaceae bacterium]|nr:hypothetical protein [Kofleriaceae bacterium]
MSARFTALAVHTQPEALGELVDLLSTPDLKVDTARSEREALHKIGTGAYSVLLVGHLPPLLDGVKLLERSTSILPDALRILMVRDANEAIDL